MTVFFIVLLCGFIILMVARLAYTQRKKRTDSNSLRSIKTYDYTISKLIPYRDESEESSKNRVGKLTRVSDKEWILNPDATFPLTIRGADETTASTIKTILEQTATSSIYEIQQVMLPVIAQHNIRCKEIDQYINKYKPCYLQSIEEMKSGSPEWNEASELDRQDLLEEFKLRALESLQVRPYCDIEVLFEESERDHTVDDVLINRYGFDSMRFYLRKSKRLNKVHVVPADSRDREKFEKLVSLGLSRQGASIEVSEILTGLTLKELNGLGEGLAPKKFSRKAQAVEFLSALDDINNRLQKHVSFRQLFQLDRLPDDLTHIDLESVARSWAFAEEVTLLLIHTYTMSDNKRRTRDYYKELGFSIRGWKIDTIDDSSCCPACREAGKKTYGASMLPRVPLHVGCRCSVQPILPDDL